jgi:hypothetical protein
LTLDALLLLTCFFCLVSFAFLDSPRYSITTLIAQWGTAYIVGRNLGTIVGAQFVSDSIAGIGAFVAIWSIVEYALQFHVFEQLGTLNASLGFWAEIQERGGVARSEAGFGHAIAMGGFLALSAPFCLVCSWSRLRIPLAVVVTVGTVCSLSRGPIASVVLSVGLALLFVPGSRIAKRTRLVGITVLVFACVIVAPRILSRFDAVDNELAPSTEYRQRLWVMIPEDMALLGQAQNVGIDSSGRSLYRNLGSIDSTPLIIGLSFGWIVVGLLAIAMIAAIVRVLRGTSSIAEIALVGQIPTLTTVALITQYGAAVWLLVGLVAASSLQRGSGSGPVAAKRTTLRSSHDSAVPKTGIGMEAVTGAGEHLSIRRYLSRSNGSDGDKLLEDHAPGSGLKNER